MKEISNEITYRDINTLHKLENNPRTITEEDFEILIESIENNPDYLEARPLVLSDRTGELVIIAGNQRFEAAKKLKMTEVPTILLSGLTEEREKELIIRDNISNGRWDIKMLRKDYSENLLTRWGIQEISRESLGEIDLSEFSKKDKNPEKSQKNQEHTKEHEYICKNCGTHFNEKGEILDENN